MLDQANIEIRTATTGAISLPTRDVGERLHAQNQLRPLVQRDEKSPRPS